jgi:glycosyltransferase involved in cell wall biosynthesis
MPPRAQIALRHQAHDFEHAARFQRIHQSGGRTHDARRMGDVQRRHVEADSGRAHESRRGSVARPSVTSIDSSKPAVAFLIDRWDPQRGGAERAMVWFARHLVERGYRVLAVAEQHSPRAPGERVAVSATGWTRAQRERRLARALVAAAEQHGAAVTIGCRHLYECDLYWPHGGAHLATLRAVRKAQRTPNWMPVHPRHRQFVAFERELLERGGARRIACVSKLVRDELAREWPASRDRLVLAENGVDLEAFHPRLRATLGTELRAELGLPSGALLLGFIARNWVLKGLKPLANAVRRVYGDAPEPWRVLAAGWMPPPAVVRALPDRFMWREQVFAPALMAAADVTCTRRIETPVGS